MSRTVAAAAAVMAFLAALAFGPPIPPAAANSTWPYMISCGAGPNPVTQGQTTTISGTAEGVLLTIDWGQYAVDTNPDPNANTHVNWSGIGGIDMVGAWGTPEYLTFSATLDTTALSVGTHEIFIHAYGSNGQWAHPCGGSPPLSNGNPNSLVLQVDPPGTDNTAPQHGNATFYPDSLVGPGESLLLFQMTLDDTGDPGTATIAGAPNAPGYWVDACPMPAWPTNALVANDSAFDEEVEVVEAWIDTAGWMDNTYSVNAVGEDSLGNAPSACLSALFTVARAVTDTQAPLAYSGSVSPSTVPFGGGPVDLSASFDDTTTGNSNLVAAEWFVAPTDGSPPFSDGAGNAMSPLDGAWDSPSEGVVEWQNLGVGVSAWAVGTYTFYLHGRDNAGNWGSWSNPAEYVTATLTIGTPPPPIPNPPTFVILNVSVSGNDLLLGWTPPVNPAGLDHYNIYRAGAPTANGCPTGTRYLNVSAATTSLTEPGLAADANRYYYNVRSANVLDQEDSACAMVGKIAVDLGAGVSEISTPLIPSSAAPSDIFLPIWSAFYGVGAYDPTNGWRFYNKTMGGSLTSISNSMGLRVDLTTAARLPLVGRVPVNPISRAIAFAGTGWYFIGVPHLNPSGLTTASDFDANGLAGAWSRVLYYNRDPYDPWAQYDVANAGFRDLATVFGGGGYWIRITAAGTWTPPLI